MTRRITLFLASSSELKAERAAIEVRIGRKNKQWHDQGLFLHLEIWEDFVDTVSRTRKQDDYNQAIRRADLFVLLVHTKVGMYSAEEFKTAHEQFQAGGRPFILTYFKNPPGPGEPEPGPDYRTVRELLAQLAALGHFPNPYTSVDGLLLHLDDQLEKLRARGVIAGDAAGAALPATTFSGQVRGSGALAQGPGAVAAGAGGVAIGGANHAPVTVVQTGGGAYVNGPVSIHGGGSFVGRDQVVHGAPAADTAALLAALLQATQRCGAPAAQEIAEAVQAEAAAPAPDRPRMARLLDGLTDLVPGAVAALAGALFDRLVKG